MCSVRRRIAEGHRRKARLRLRSSGTSRGKETAVAPLNMKSAAAGLLTGAVAIELPPAARIRGRRGPSSHAKAGPSVAQKSPQYPLCDGKRLRRGGRALRRTSARKDRLVDNGGFAARFVERSSRFFDGLKALPNRLEALPDCLASSFPGPVMLRISPPRPAASSSFFCPL